MSGSRQDRHCSICNIIARNPGHSPVTGRCPYNVSLRDALRYIIGIQARPKERERYFRTPDVLFGVKMVMRQDKGGVRSCIDHRKVNYMLYTGGDGCLYSCDLLLQTIIRWRYCTVLRA